MVAPGPRELDLRELRSGTIGILTSDYGGMLAECGAVCLEQNGHHSGSVTMKVAGTVRREYRLHFDAVTEQMRRCYNDEQVTTEHGAYGVAILVARDVTDLEVVNKSRKGTGFDYWLGTAANGLFDDAARLEVSGIRNGSPSEVSQRVKQKVEQTKVSDRMGLPAVVVVVEFGAPHSRFIKR